MIRLRLAKVEDVEALAELRQESALYQANLLSGVKLKENTKGFLLENTKEAIENPQKRVFLSIKDEKVLAYIIATLEEEHPFLDFGKAGMIDDIYVRPSIQKTGSGKTLLNMALKWFQEEDINTVKLNVYLENKVGVNFWKKTGFTTLASSMIKQL